ncbi:MAG TPA: hypothetical protein VH496_02175 [Mycobacterium sp.]|jgi:hypothetical protein
MPEPEAAEDRVEEPAARPPEEPMDEATDQPAGVPEHCLKRWTLVLMLVAVWIPAAAIGLGLFHWWFYALDKTWPVLVVLIVVAVCTVAGLLTAMVDGKPLVAALAIAIMSAPFAATAAAAPLYGVTYCQTLKKIDATSRCLINMIPY